MKKFNPTEIWKCGIDKDIKNLSDKELSAKIVNSARKSMSVIYPNWILIYAAILVIIFLFWKIITGINGNENLVIYQSILIIFISVCLIFLICSTRKINHYSFDMPVKSWLEIRITKIEQSNKFIQKYGILVNIITIAISITSVAIYNYLLNINFNYISFAIASLIVCILLIIAMRQQRRYYKRILRHLLDLYNRL
ncbi:MAG: hypothetical protein RR667_01525 [Muribaculaceae bacterium]